MKLIARLLRLNGYLVSTTSGMIFLVLAASVVIILLFRSILPASLAANESSDYVSFYEPVARNLLAGHGLVTNSGTAAIQYPPGFPLLLAGLFGLAHLTGLQESVVLLAFTLLCTALNAVFVFLLARTLWKPLPSLFVSLVWMTYPIALWLTKQPSSEIPFISLFFGVFLLVWSAIVRNRLGWAIAIVSGVLIGFAMLVRPIAIGVGLIMAFMIWISYTNTSIRHRLFLSAMLLLGNVMAILPWQAWVHAKTGQVILLCRNGVPSILDGLTFSANKLTWREGAALPADVAEISRDILDRSQGVQTFGSLLSLVADETRARPTTMAKFFAIKAARSWYATDSNRFETPTIVIQILYLTFTIWGSLIVWKRGGMPKKMVITVWLMVFYFWGMTTLALSIVRYMFPVMGLLFLFLPGVLSRKLSAVNDTA